MRKYKDILQHKRMLIHSLLSLEYTEHGAPSSQNSSLYFTHTKYKYKYRGTGKPTKKKTPSLLSTSLLTPLFLFYIYISDQSETQQTYNIIQIDHVTNKSRLQQQETNWKNVGSRNFQPKKEISEVKNHPYIIYIYVYM